MPRGSAARDRVLLAAVGRAGADYTARHFPDYAELLARAKAWRLGEDTVTFMMPDAHAACDLIDAVAADASAIPEYPWWKAARMPPSGNWQLAD